MLLSSPAIALMHGGQTAAETAQGDKVKDFVMSFMPAKSAAELHFAVPSVRYQVGGHSERHPAVAENFQSIHSALQDCAPSRLRQTSAEENGLTWYQVDFNCRSGEELALLLVAGKEGVSELILNIGGFPPTSVAEPK
jgi:hypothetical protein